jgi:hypothetical protein
MLKKSARCGLAWDKARFVAPGLGGLKIPAFLSILRGCSLLVV